MQKEAILDIKFSPKHWGLTLVIAVADGTIRFQSAKDLNNLTRLWLYVIAYSMAGATDASDQLFRLQLPLLESSIRRTPDVHCGLSLKTIITLQLRTCD